MIVCGSSKGEPPNPLSNFVPQYGSGTFQKMKQKAGNENQEGDGYLDWSGSDIRSISGNGPLEVSGVTLPVRSVSAFRHLLLFLEGFPCLPDLPEFLI
jgi:hypothetical protein